MGQPYAYGLGSEISLEQTSARLRQLVEQGLTLRIRAITVEGIIEAAKSDDGVTICTLSPKDAAPILKACKLGEGELSYEDSLMLDDGFEDIEVHGYDGDTFTLPSDTAGERGLTVGSVSRLHEEVKEAIAHAREMMADEPECRTEYRASIKSLELLGKFLENCATYDLVLRTWEL